MDIITINVLLEALNNRQQMQQILVSEKKNDKKIQQIKGQCRRLNIPVKTVPQIVIDRKAGKDNQGIFAQTSPIRFFDTDHLIANRKTDLILILDKINDTGNLGAIIRSAAAADIDGIIIPKHGSAPINETVLKASAGGLLKVKIVQATNLNSEIEKLKKNGYWIASTVMDGDTPYHEYDFSYKTAIIMGNEHSGVSALLNKNADYRLSIPISSQIESLNVSVASAIILFEALRQKIQIPKA